LQFAEAAFPGDAAQAFLAGETNPSDNKGVSYRGLSEALLQGRPYFGTALLSWQALPERLRCFLPVVKAVAQADVEILEIGSWAGASAKSWAWALKKLGLKGHVTCVDAWLPYCDLEKEKSGYYLGHYQRMSRAAESGMIYKLFQHNVSASGFGETIVAKIGKSREILPQLASSSFHVVYVDASHLLEDVLFDLREAKRLVQPGGIICGDDLELQLEDLEPAEVEEAARSGYQFVSSRSGVPYHPGVTLAVGREFGKVSEWSGFWAVRAFGTGWSSVTLDEAAGELPEHVFSAVTKIEGDTETHYLISNQGRYCALAKALGSPNMAAELVREEDVPPWFYTAGTLEELRGKVEQHQQAWAMVELLSENTPKLVGTYCGFNLVRFKMHTYGLRPSLGPVDVRIGNAEILSRYGEQDAIIAASIDGVTARIDAQALRQEQMALAGKLQALTDQVARGTETDPRFQELLEAMRGGMSALNASIGELRTEAAERARDIQEHMQSVQRETRALSNEIAEIRSGAKNG